ncbi:MAG: DNA polymerase, partial [Methanomassiliicoccales archaeon]
IIYGLTPQGLVRNLKMDGINITLDDSTRFIQAFFSKFPQLAQWLEHQRTRVGNWVYTQSGRRVFVSPFNANLTMNAPVQGTGADMMKLWLVHFHRYCMEHQLPYPVIMAVHDEIVMHSPEYFVDTYVELLKKAFKNAQDDLFPNCPFDFKMDYAVGDAWSDKA